LQTPRFNTAYETDYSKRMERRICGILCEKWNLKPSPDLPWHNILDYLLFKNGQAVCFAEIKYRNKVYETYYVALNKMRAGINYTDITGLPSYLVVEFPDPFGIQYVEMSKDIIHHVGMSNLKSRGDDQDNEVVVHVEMAQFKPIENSIYSWGQSCNLNVIPF